MRTLPLRVRLVAGFVAAMLVVLTAAAAFVYWRVSLALDAGVDERLAAQSVDLRRALAAHPGDPAAALATTDEQIGQVLRPDGTVAAATSPSAAQRVLLTPSQRAAAMTRTVRADLGNLLTSSDRRLRVVAFPAAPGVAVTAVRTGQRDEALRELLAQLALANLAALVVASAVGYRLTHAALAPVEQYRARAQQIAAGDPTVRLDVRTTHDDEITRLGVTLNEMLAAQAAAAERQRRFVADASHELRTPLSLLTTEVELALRRPRSNEEYEQTLRHVAADTARLTQLADQLLTSQARPAGTTSSADLTEAARRAAGRGAAQAADVVVRAAEPVLVPASDQDLDLLLGNLVDNAVRHGDGAVALTVHRADGCVLGAVHDEGPGLPADFLPHAADRFRRADSARGTTGSGLGLAIVREVVAGLGGELRICSGGTHHTYPPARFGGTPCDHPFRGTTASVLLPALEGPDVPA